uniref:Odorant receptor n=1 Tax=Aphidius gifuensis TaxID=684658 RepID=A0A3S5HSS9_APHGI|nr:odorant receptor [Aphidius gifuensis]
MIMYFVYWAYGILKIQSQRENFFFYKLYTGLLVVTLYTFTLSQLIKMFTSLDNPDDFSKASFMSITMTATCFKVYDMLSKKKLLARLINTLDNGSFKSRNSIESSIQSNFFNKIKLLIFLYGTLNESTATTITLASIIRDAPQRALAYKAWLPFDESKPIFYWIAFIHQHFGGYCAASMSVAFDTMVVGLMISVCAQLRVLKYRIHHGYNTVTYEQKKNYENDYLVDCIQHHNAIFQFAELSNYIFSKAIFFQYFASSIVLCVSTFSLSQEKTFSKEFNNLIMYLACMLSQIYVLCNWSTNVHIESTSIATGVYESDWPSLLIGSRKNLVIMMIRTLRPIQYSSGYIVNLSLTAFANLLKTSYSAYNILQKSKSRTE